MARGRRILLIAAGLSIGVHIVAALLIVVLPRMLPQEDRRPVTKLRVERSGNHPAAEDKRIVFAFGLSEIERGGDLRGWLGWWLRRFGLGGCVRTACGGLGLIDRRRHRFLLRLLDRRHHRGLRRLLGFWFGRIGFSCGW